MDWQIYLAKARNSLRTAQHAYEHGDADSCVSRAYFAVFHSEIAALVKLTPFRQDRWGDDRVQAEFNRRLIQERKLFAASLRFTHNDLIGRRHVADYKDNISVCKRPNGAYAKRSRWCQPLQTYWRYHEDPTVSDQ
jgi:uncharacterized protein (UPF0332 family)